MMTKLNISELNIVKIHGYYNINTLIKAKKITEYIFLHSFIFIYNNKSLLAAPLNKQYRKKCIEIYMISNRGPYRSRAIFSRLSRLPVRFSKAGNQNALTHFSIMIKWNLWFPCIVEITSS